MLKVILVSGLKRSGKDFVSAKMQSLIGGSIVMAFAEPLKDIIATTMSVSKDELEEYKNNGEHIFTHSEIYMNDTRDKEPFTNFRLILQRFGTEAMKKHFGDDVWVHLLATKLPDDGVVIVSDWRFKREFEVLSKLAKVYTVRVDDVNLTTDDLHPSETELEDFNFNVRIDNSNKDDRVFADILHFVQRLSATK